MSQRRNFYLFFDELYSVGFEILPNGDLCRYSKNEASIKENKLEISSAIKMDVYDVIVLTYESEGKQ